MKLGIGKSAGAAAAEPFLRSMVGILALLLTVCWVEPLFFGAGYYAELAVHPFWIVVILGAAQGGLFVGVTTAALAGLMMDWPARPLDMDITDHYAELAIVPVQWLLSAVFIGAFRQMQIAEETALRKENARLLDDNEIIAAEVERLDAAVFRLELAAATRTTEGGAALNALAWLGRSAADDLPARLRAAASTLTRRPGAAFLPPATMLFWGDATSIVPRDIPGPGDGPRIVDLSEADGAARGACCAFGGADAPGWVTVRADSAEQAGSELGVAAVLAQALECALSADRGRGLVETAPVRGTDEPDRVVPIRIVG